MHPLGHHRHHALIAVIMALTTLAAGVGHVPAPAWAAAPVALAAAFSDTDGRCGADFDLLGALRLIQGDSGLGGKVRPGDSLTRAEFAALVLRLKGIAADGGAESEARPAFADADRIPAWALGYVNAAKAHGLIRGFEDGTFRPDQGVLLAEGLAMLSRLLGREDELDPARAWPESYLELGERIGLSGRLTGYGNVGLDRAGIAHLSAQAPTVPIDQAGSCGTLLDERFGFQRGLLQTAGDGRLTVGGQFLSLADPYVCGDGTIEPLVGRTVDVLLLPGSDEAAIVVASGTRPWCPEGYLGYHSDRPGPLALEANAWWQDILDLDAAHASRYCSPGALSSAKVRLFLPRADGGEVDGILHVKGTTTQPELMIRDHIGTPWTPVAVMGGSFDQRFYFAAGRGDYYLQFMTPVPGKGDYYYEDLGFRVKNMLALVNDPRYDAGFTWPRADLVEAEGFVDIAGFAPGERVHVQLTYGHELALHHLPVRNGYFSGRIWLTHGPGRYEIRLCLDSGEESRYLLTDAAFRADSVSPSPDEWAAPGVYIQSGSAAVHDLAATATAGEKTAYGKAKAIYRWVARHLTYDLVRAADPTEGQLTSLEIIARGRGVCEDYANVFAAMCRTLGIECRVATGVTFADNQNHAWNEFRDGGRWVSVDATWGAGYVANGVFHHDPTDAWFDRDLGPTHLRGGVRSDWQADTGG